MTYDPAPYDQTRYTQTEEVGFFQRVGASLIGIPLGIILIFFPMSLLWWNEHRALDAFTAIELALEKVVTVPASPVRPETEGRLVHVVGVATTASGVSDPTLGLVLPGAIVVERQVEMFQWRERQSRQSNTNWGGSQTVTTTTSYDQLWSAVPFDSSLFLVSQNHLNPPMPVQSVLIVADDARLGGFRLGATTLSALTTSGLGPDVAGFLPFASPDAPRVAPSAFILLRPAKAPSGFVLEDTGALYRGKTPTRPAIGDLRIRYVGVPAGKTMTVIAKQMGDGFSDYPITRNMPIQMAAVGEFSSQALLDERANREDSLTWIVRGIGVMIMWFGFMLVLGPLATLVSIVPFFGTLAEGLTADIAFVLAAILGAITIAVAWLFVHPLVSIGLILAALMVGGTYLYIRRA